MITFFGMVTRRWSSAYDVKVFDHDEAFSELTTIRVNTDNNSQVPRLGHRKAVVIVDEDQLQTIKTALRG